MRFLIDNNVPTAVAVYLRSLGHDVALVREELTEDAPDPLVATTAMEQKRVLVSHDKDMKRIERKISTTWIERYPKLCRVQLCCNEVQSASRLEAFMGLIELEFATLAGGETPMLIDIKDRNARFWR